MSPVPLFAFVIKKCLHSSNGRAAGHDDLLRLGFESRGDATKE